MENSLSNTRVDLTSENLPNLHAAKELNVDLSSEYWTPEKEGESKLIFFQDIKTSTYTDEKSGEITELPCVIMIEQLADQSLKTVRNGSKRLVAAIETEVKANRIEIGTPLKITYLGKRKNSSNSFQSDIWSIKPLIVLNADDKLKLIENILEEKESLIPTDEFTHYKRIVDEREETSYDKLLTALKSLK